MKKIFSLFLALCLILTFAPMPVGATVDTVDAVTALTINGVDVIAGTTSGPGWSYADNVLTLDNYTCEIDSYEYVIKAVGDLTITVLGTCELSNESYEMDRSVIYVEGTLTINGGGILNASMNQIYDTGCVIYASELINITGTTVNVLVDDLAYGASGITAGAGMNLTAVSLLNVTINQASGYYTAGILVEDGNASLTDSTINVNIAMPVETQDTDLAVNPCGLCIQYGNLTVTNGNISSILSGGNASRAIGIFIYGDLNITNGSSVSGVAEGFESVGVVTIRGDINVDNSNLYGEGDNYGINVGSLRRIQVKTLGLEEEIYEGGSLNVNITDPKFTVHGVATGEADYNEMDNEIAYAPNILSLPTTTATLTKEDLVTHVQKFLSDNNISQYYDLLELKKAVEIIYDTEMVLSDFETDEDYYAEFDSEYLNDYFFYWYQLYNYIPMGIIVEDLSLDSARIITPLGGIMSEIMFWERSTIYEVKGVLPSTNVIIGAIVNEPVTEAPTQPRTPVVAGALAVNTGDMGSNYLVISFILAITAMGASVVIVRKRKQ